MMKKHWLRQIASPGLICLIAFGTIAQSQQPERYLTTPVPNPAPAAVTAPPDESARSPIARRNIERLVEETRVVSVAASGLRTVTTQHISAQRRTALGSLVTMGAAGLLGGGGARSDSAYFIARLVPGSQTPSYFIGYRDDAPNEAALSLITATALTGVVTPMASRPILIGTPTCARVYHGGAYVGNQCNLDAEILYEVPEASVRALAARFTTEPRVPMVVTRYQADNADLDHFVLFPGEAAALMQVVDRELARQP
jgi:hypothetical protein